MIRHLVRLSFALCSVASVATAQVFVVDQAGGPGANFTDLPAAVGSVPEGAVLVVRPGTYSAFVLFDKGLEVYADGPGVVVDGSTRVFNLSFGKWVVLSGLDLRFTGPSPTPTFVANNSQGSIRMQDLVLDSVNGDVLALVSSCSDLTMAGCILAPTTTDATLGMQVTDLPGQSTSQIALFDTFVQSVGSNPPSTDGLPAMIVQSGAVVRIESSALLGASGQPGTFSGGTCTLPPGNGGAALGVGSSAQVDLFGTALVGGTPAATVPGCPVPSAGPGTTNDGTGAVSVDTTSPVSLFDAQAVRREGQNLDLSYFGAPGEIFVWAWYAVLSGGAFTPQQWGFLSSTTFVFLDVLGTVGPGGVLQVSLPLGPLPPGLVGLPIHHQGLRVTGLDVRMLAPRTSLWLSASL